MTLVRLVRAASCALFLTFAGCAQTDTGASPAAGVPSDISMEEMMARAIELATPGDAHAALQPMIGRFKSEMSYYTPMGVMSSTGVAQNDWALGNRFVSSKYKSEMDGQPFEGIGMLGHDNATGEYQGFWIDSMGTMMMPLSHGTYDAATRTLTMEREVDMPDLMMVGTMRDITVIESREKHTFHIEMVAADGSISPMLDIVYTRM